MKKYSKTIFEIILHGVVWIFVMLFPFLFMDFDKPHPPMFDNWMEMLLVMVIFVLNVKFGQPYNQAITMSFLMVSLWLM